MLSESEDWGKDEGVEPSSLYAPVAVKKVEEANQRLKYVCFFLAMLVLLVAATGLFNQSVHQASDATLVTQGPDATLATASPTSSDTEQSRGSDVRATASPTSSGNAQEQSRGSGVVDPLLTYTPKRVNCNPSWRWYNKTEMKVPETCLDVNLLFLKGPKTGSSTMGGVARRIAARYGVNCVECGIGKVKMAPEPKLVADHQERAPTSLKINKFALDTFAWGQVRDPAERCLSDFYYIEVTRAGVEPTPENMIAHGRKHSDFLYKYYDLDRHPEQVQFLGLTERYAESVLLIAYFFDLSLGDILYTAAKNSTSGVADVVSFSNNKKLLKAHVPLAQQPQEVQDYFYGPFREQNKNDIRIHEEASARIDSLIEGIGRVKFEQALSDFKGHLKGVEDECNPYGADGGLLPGEKCYWRDNACGYKCFDKYATDNNLWQPVFNRGLNN